MTFLGFDVAIKELQRNKLNAKRALEAWANIVFDKPNVFVLAQVTHS